MSYKPELDEKVIVDGIGTGYVAMTDAERTHIEFVDADHDPITIPTGHLGTSLYETTGEIVSLAATQFPTN